MSRGPGTIERAIEAAFRESPGSILMTDDLVCIAYPGSNRAEKKHRVAVLRAADKVGRRLYWAGYRCERFGGQIVYCNMCDITSYSLGRLRADFVHNRKSLDELAASLEPGGRNHKWIAQDGTWRKHVEINCKHRDGLHEEAKAQAEALNASVAPLLNALTSALKKK